MTISRKIFLALLIPVMYLLVFFLFSGSAFAQDATVSPSPADAPPDPAAQYNITFPVGELGGCADMGACQTYCQDPVYVNNCLDYAKGHGFYVEDAVQGAGDEFFERAKGVLGCDSNEACLDYCAEVANHEKCDAFSKSEGIPGGYVDQPDKPEYLQIAKNTLGCDSLESCAQVCDDIANQQKCSDFADQVGLLGGIIPEGPGSCTTDQTCQVYCSDPNNFSECDQFSGGSFTGPDGCDSVEGCRAVCEASPEVCRSYAPGSNGVYVPVACSEGEYHGPGGACTATADTQKAAACVGANNYWNGETCADSPPEGVDPNVPGANFEQRPDMGNCKTPGECYDWCKENTGKCGGFDESASRPTDEYTPYLYYTPGTDVKFDAKPEMGNCDSPGSCYDWCKDNAGGCQGFSEDSPRPLDVYVPGTYYTPPTDVVYVTPSNTSFYVTPIYFTPPAGSNYTTPQYYTPGSYSSPTYYSPPTGSNYTSPTYYTPGSDYYTPSGAEYPSPNYTTPRYYTPPAGSNYTTPYYYTPPHYTTPYYYTPPAGSNYTTPSYTTPPAYTTPVYYTPYTGGNYTSPTYYTPPTYVTPVYYTPPEGSSYTSPTYYTPPPPYVSPTYYTPGTYPTPNYATPPEYTTPNYTYPTPGSGYTTPQYYTPYGSPSYASPSYYYPTPGSGYASPSYPTPYGSPSYTYPTPGSGYGTPSYPSPSYSYPTPGTGYSYPSPSYYSPTYGTPTYGTPTYGTPTYGTPSYGTPEYPSPSYGSPSYGTPEYHSPSYGTPEYPTPSYGTPSSGAGRVAGTRTWFSNIWGFFQGLFR